MRHPMDTWLRVGGALCCATLLGLATPVAAAKFNNASVDGRYSGAVDGLLFLADPLDLDAAPVPEPFWAVVYFNADGDGTLRSIRSTYNVGGCLILDLRGSGTYRVRSTGLGEATVTLTVRAVDLIPACEGIDFPLTPPERGDNAEFKFEFGVNQAEPNVDQRLEVIGTTVTLFVPNPGDPTNIIPLTVPSGAQGTILRQER